MTPLYEIRSVSGQENQLGVFATKTIGVSQVLCSERPFFRVDGQPGVIEPLIQEVLNQHHANELGGQFSSEHLGAIVESRLLQKTIAARLAGCKSAQDTMRYISVARSTSVTATLKGTTSDASAFSATTIS
jgi:hypothetical protein